MGVSDPPAPVRRLIGAGRYAAAESLALDLLTRPAGDLPDSADVADVLDLMVEAMVSGGRWWEPRAEAAMERSLAIRALDPGRDSLDLARSLLVLGRLRDVRWDPRGAGEAFLRLARLRERALGPDHPELAAPLRRAGLARSELGDGHSADSLIRRSVAIAERALASDHPERIESDFALAMLASDRGSGDTTLFASVIERTERVFGPRHPLVAARLKSLSSVHRGAARHARAHQALSRAHAIYLDAFGPRSLLTAQAWMAIGVNHIWSGHFDLAAPYFEECSAMIRELTGPDHVEMIGPMLNLGDVYARLGDTATGLALLEHAVEIADRELPEDHWLVSLARLMLGETYLGTGQAPLARPILERVLAFYTRTRPAGSWEIAWSMDLLARTQVDTKRARELYEGAARIYLETFGPNHHMGNRGRALLSKYRLVDGDTLGAIAMRDSTISVSRRILGPDSPDVAWGLLALGQMYGARGRYEEAVRCLERSAAAFANGSGPEHPLTAMGLRELAVWQAASGRAREAFQTAGRAEAIRREHLFFNASGMPENEALALLRAHPMTQGAGVNVMLSLASGALAGDTAAGREAWNALIRSRAMVLDEMGVRHRSWALGADPEVAALAARFDSAARRLASLELRAAEPGRHLGLLTDLHRARTERNRAERALAARSASSRGRGSRERMGLDSVVALLPDRAALVAYARYERFEVKGGQMVATPSYLACVLGEDDTPALVPLGAASRIDSLVTRWRQELEWDEVRRGGEPAAERRYRRVAAQLRRAVWDPVAERIGRVPRAFVVPDGPLGLVNFATLPAGASTYLIEQGPAIQYLSAERDLALGSEAPSFGHGLLAMGDPAFDSMPAASDPPAPDGPVAVNGFRGPRAGCLAFGAVRFGPLPASGEEIGVVARLWRTLPASASGSLDARGTTVDSLTGTRASESDFRSRVSGHRVVHLATHGFFVQGECAAPATGARGIGGMIPATSAAPSPAGGEHPLRLSGFALAGANLRSRALPGQDDGILTAEEIAALDLTGVQWAVLSACETGVGEYRSGEGLMGFRRAFHIAGARTTIMSLWRVRDRAAARWMRALYENRWHRGLDTAGSVRAASLEALRVRRAAGLATHPAHWGAFIAMGDWR